jgi:23S rRNA (pseudouridine1915-N3)-methyltransferase
LKITLLAIADTDANYLKEGIEIYLNRLKHYAKFELKTLTINKKDNVLPPAERKLKEGELMLKHLEPGDFLVLLDEKGKTFTSRQFADYLQKHMLSGIKRLVFVIGGAYGFSDEVYALAQGKLSLSNMTFSHQMIRLFVVEQVYRAFTILKNEPYHND